VKKVKNAVVFVHANTQFWAVSNGMKHMIRMHRHLDAPQELIVVRLLVMMGSAAVSATTSLYLKSLGLSDSTIGIATGVIMAVNLGFVIMLPKILEKYSLNSVLLSSIVGFAISLVLFGSIKNASIALCIYGATRLLLSAFATSYSILFHDDSPSEESFRKNQSLAGSLGNFSWMFAPFVASVIVVQYSFFILYIISAAIVVLAIIILRLQKIPEPHKKHRPSTSILTNIKTYFSSKHLRDAYIMNASVSIWWSFMFAFVTLYMNEAGFSTAAIGVFLTLTQLPLFLFEFKTHVIVDKFRYKRPMILAHSALAIAMIIVAIFGLHIATLGILIAASLAIVYLEPAREMYLYGKIDISKEEKIQPIYLTAEMLSSMILRISVGVILLVLPAQATYLAVALVMGLIAFHSRTIKD